MLRVLVTFKWFSVFCIATRSTTRLDDICLQRVIHDSSFSGHDSWFYFRYDSLSYLNDLSQLIFLAMKRLVSISPHGFTKNKFRFFTNKLTNQILFGLIKETRIVVIGCEIRENSDFFFNSCGEQFLAFS